MKEAFGNIWDFAEDYHSMVITTNGFVKKNGEAVMGRGIALEAKERFPWFPKWLGDRLTEHGNNVYQVLIEPRQLFVFSIYTFPVKPEFGPKGEMGWKAKADIELIARSARQLVKKVDEATASAKNYKVVMPRPGCGNGGLKWEDVRPVIEPILDDRFTVCTFSPL